MPMLDVCVVGEINLDLILYGLPKDLVLDRELLATGLGLRWAARPQFLPITCPCLEARLGSSRKRVATLSGKWRLRDCPLAGSKFPT